MNYPFYEKNDEIARDCRCIEVCCKQTGKERVAWSYSIFVADKVKPVAHVGRGGLFASKR